MYLSMSIHHFAIYNAHKLRYQPLQILCVASCAQRDRKTLMWCNNTIYRRSEVATVTDGAFLPLLPYNTVKKMYHLAGFD